MSTPPLPLCTTELHATLLALRRTHQREAAKSAITWTCAVVDVRATAIDRSVEYASAVGDILVACDLAYAAPCTPHAMADVARQIAALRAAYYPHVPALGAAV